MRQAESCVLSAVYGFENAFTTRTKLKVLIHIGAHKTGTTSIQDYFADNAREIFGSSKVLYPMSRSVGFKGNHTDLTVGMLLNLNRLGRMVVSRVNKTGLTNSQYYDRYISELKDDINDKKPDAVLISTEAFFGKAHEYDWKKLSYALGVAISEFEFVVYLRDPATHYLSLVQQKLKHSSKFKFPRSVPFKKIIQSYENMFPGRVNIRILESVGDSVQDISVLLGINKHVSNSLQPTRKNESLSPEAMSIIQMYRREYMPELDDIVTKEGRVLLHSVFTADNSISGKGKPKLFDSVSNYINCGAREDITWLKKKYNIDVPWAVDTSSLMDIGECSMVSDICHVDQSRQSKLMLRVKLMQSIMRKIAYLRERIKN